MFLATAQKGEPRRTLLAATAAIDLAEGRLMGL
jgi:hypothetical protein